MNNNNKHKPIYREGEWSDLDLESFKEIMKNQFGDSYESIEKIMDNEIEENKNEIEKEIIAKNFEENLKKDNPEGYKRFIDSVNSILEEQKTDPNYFEKLVIAQFNGLIVKR
jgi:hypothetical protein